VIRSDKPAPPGGRKKRGFAVQKSVHRIFGRTRATMLGAALMSGAALPAAGLWAGSALAITNPVCHTTAGLVTCTFSSTPSPTSWTVPAGITTVTVGADGASGANAASTFVTGGGSGGKGGEYKAVLTNIPAGTVLSVFPGRAATGATGGTNAMGAGGNSTTDANTNTGGGGGGATTVAIAPFSVGHLLVVAGGGGGGGAENQAANTPANGGNGGGSGGVNGQDGFLQTGSGRGRGGTTIAGGANGGDGGCTNSATDGSQLRGGNSNSGVGCPFVGGGGGSGYFGGGGSATGNGAGGGSAFPAGLNTVGGITVTPDTTEHATHTGNGTVTISYQQVATRIRPNIFFNFHQTFTVTGTLSSPAGPVAGQPVTVSTGGVNLCTATTDSHGVAKCVLTYAESVAIRQNSGRYTVTFPGSDGYLPSSASGQAIIFP
jgi:hypothetical protein